MFNEVNPTLTHTFVDLDNAIQTLGHNYFNGVFVGFASVWLERKFTIVQSKYRWDTDDGFNTDIILAHFNGTFMTTKVGKCFVCLFFFNQICLIYIPFFGKENEL